MINNQDNDKKVPEAIRFFTEDENDVYNQEMRDILDDNGKATGYLITEHCHLIDGRTGKDLTIKSNNRPFGRINMNKESRIHSLTRIARRAFDDESYPLSHYESLVIDHVIPVTNEKQNHHISNLEWVTPGENKRRAEQLNMGNYHHPKEKIHTICKLICQGKSRQEILKLVSGINPNLIDDIKSGRSHKDISAQYLNKGFEYRTFDREEKHALVKHICELLQLKKYTPKEITEILNISNKSFVNDILHRRTFTKISKDYDF